MRDVQPLADLVMVEQIEHKVEKNGLVLPTELQPDLEEGRAVAFGPDVPEEAVETMKLCGGVLFGHLDHEARACDFDGKRYLFIQYRDLMGAVFLGKASRIARIQEALRKWVLMSWEEAKGTLLGGFLLRPVEKSQAHFTGTVIKVGNRADEIEVGKRYFFEQFSGFKSWTEDGVRYAFVPVDHIYCEIPERTADVCLSPAEVASPEFSEAYR